MYITRFDYCQMGKIEELLIPGERVIKKKGGVTASHQGSGTGDLHLTNQRLIFTPKKRYALLGQIFSASLIAKDLLIPLQNITSLEIGFLRDLIVQANKKYSFSGLNARNWVEAIKQASSTPQQSYPQQPQFQSQPPPPPPPPPSSPRFCGNCGKPLEFIQQYNRWYCRNCQRYI